MPPDNPNDNHYNSAPDLGQAFDKIFDELTAKIERRLSKEALAAEFAIIETKFTKTMDGYAKLNPLLFRQAWVCGTDMIHLGINHNHLKYSCLFPLQDAKRLSCYSYGFLAQKEE